MAYGPQSGLFFSAVTAFVIDSYKLLQEDPVERNTWYLQQLLHQGYNASVGIPPSSIPPVPPPFSPTARNIRINVLWFSSLAISLGTVSLGIICLQWLREYQKNIPIDPQDSISIRQMRWEGLTRWKVPEILSSLPMLLNLSVTLFFAGLLELLWSLETPVATAVTVVGSLLGGFVTATTILPCLQILLISGDSLQVPQCPYKSPQSWVSHRVIVRLIQWFRPTMSLRGPKPRLIRRYEQFFDNSDWTTTDIAWNKHRKAKSEGEDLVGGLAWIDSNLGQTVEMITSIAQCIQELLPNQSIRLLQKINSMFEAFFADPEVNGSIRPKHEETPEILSSLYLEKTKRSFPQFDIQHIESTIRVLNTQLVDVSNQSTTQPNSPTPGSSPPIHHNHPLVFPFVKWPVISVHQLPTGTPDCWINSISLTHFLCPQTFSTSFLHASPSSSNYAAKDHTLITSVIWLCMCSKWSTNNVPLQITTTAFGKRWTWFWSL